MRRHYLIQCFVLIDCSIYPFHSRAFLTCCVWVKIRLRVIIMVVIIFPTVLFYCSLRSTGSSYWSLRLALIISPKPLRVHPGLNHFIKQTVFILVDGRACFISLSRQHGRLKL